MAKKNLTEEDAELVEDRDEAYDKAVLYSKCMLLGAVLAFFLHSPSARRKFGLMAYGILVMFLTSDTRFKKTGTANPDDLDQLDERDVKRKRIIFIRHGESLWNEAFNGPKRPDIFLTRSCTAFANEINIMPLFDSVLFDSPLNQVGLGQAKMLARAIAQDHDHERGSRLHMTADDLAVLRGDPGAPTSVLATSNLRCVT